MNFLNTFLHFAIQGPVSVGNSLLPEIDNFESFGWQLLRLLQSLGVVLAVIFILISGYMYFTARGDEEKIDKAKKATGYSIFGIFVLSLASLIVSTITRTVEGGEINPTPVINLADQVVGILYSAVMVITVLFLIIAGYQFITARGDEEKITKAKNAVMYSVIGLAVMNIAYFVVSIFFQVEDGEAMPRIDAGKAVELIIQITKVMLSIVGLAAVLILIFNAFAYISSRGEEEQMTKAKRGIIGAIIGLFVVVFSWSLVSIVFKIAPVPAV